MTANNTVKNKENKQKNLPYFGINRLLPYLRPYKLTFAIMVFFGLVGSATDIILPLFQQYHT